MRPSTAAKMTSFRSRPGMSAAFDFRAGRGAGCWKEGSRLRRPVEYSRYVAMSPGLHYSPTWISRMDRGGVD